MHRCTICGQQGHTIRTCRIAKWEKEIIAARQEGAKDAEERIRKAKAREP